MFCAFLRFDLCARRRHKKSTRTKDQQTKPQLDVELIRDEPMHVFHHDDFELKKNQNQNQNQNENKFIEILILKKKYPHRSAFPQSL